MNGTTGGSRAAPRSTAAPRAATPDQRVAAARADLVTRGVHLAPAAVTTALLGTTDETWERFHAHWDALSPDHYAAEQGTHRLRRYGRFSWSAATDRIRLLPQAEFVQPENSNPLYIGVSRTLEPLTDSFAADPVLRAVLRLLGQVATALDDPAEWIAKVHPFRVVASADADGLPTPEGRHRDGVTLVSSLLVGRRNVAGGESAVLDPDGARLLATTLHVPGDLLLGDDRRTLHSVSAIRPVDRGRPGSRDVLVVTFAPW
ncbi:2OG-Fe dioxygenase family protein [Nocardia higoensis]|uniref:2OG-Fe dioxygenase family protein n=1 Tax=Nocardia higoensis TaxID=228599 RepID=A0ABS0DJI2_9NOCA|nr:2OG-Fe dioxygenase family protein [Nocardia higoensis]MBF6357149.1 2OG-Fe dioxygenase family protein [Nocardia higoensis]